MRVLVTGANGFVGRALCNRLIADQFQVVAATRNQTDFSSPYLSHTQITDLSANTDWTASLQHVDVVVHLAARVHVMTDRATSPLDEFMSVNTEGTLNLARQAAAAGVRRFIFISSVKVNGEETFSANNAAFRETDAADPKDPYAISKWRAECGLQKLRGECSMEIVILRPPLVYGPGVKGNFATLIRLIDRGIPLPLASVHNKRSFIALDNLVDFISLCINREKSSRASNEVFLLSDGEDISTPELLRRIGQAYNKPARLLPAPESWLHLMARILNQGAIADRLLGSLVVDSSKARELLNWHPVSNMYEQLEMMAKYDSHT